MVDWYSIPLLPDSSRKMHTWLSISYLSLVLFLSRARYRFLLWIFKEYPTLSEASSHEEGYDSLELRYIPFHTSILEILSYRYTSIALDLWFRFDHKGTRPIPSNGSLRKLMFSSYILYNNKITCKNVPNLAAMERIQTRTWLIQKDNSRITNQSNSNRKPSLHSSRQLFRFQIFTVK